jgi:hypothetical protein
MVYLTTLLVDVLIATNNAVESWERRCCKWIKALFSHFPGLGEENTKNLAQ